MASRQLINITDKASLNPVLVGNTLTMENSNTAYPEGGQKRCLMGMKAVSTGATSVELAVDNVPNYRVRPAADSIMVLKIFGSYINSVQASNAAWEMTVVLQNVGNVCSIIGTPLVTPYPGAAAATLVPTVNTLYGLVLTGTGVAGNTNGRWNARVIVSEVTDLG